MIAKTIITGLERQQNAEFTTLRKLHYLKSQISQH